MILIGVTGGVCTGKTTACAFFKELGAACIDADRIVHKLYKKDKEIKRAVLKNFGRDVFTKGRIDRIKLAGIVFKSKRKLKILSKIVHPRVIKKIKERIKRTKKAVTVLDAPLLIETGLERCVDYVVVIKATFDNRRARCARRGLERGDLLARRAFQMPMREKTRYADFVIDNNRSKKYIKKEVIKIWKALKRG